MRYLGPSDNLSLEEGGPVYHPGDDVPISAKLAAHLGQVANGNHRFEGVESEARPRSSDFRSARAAADTESGTAG